MRPLFLNSRIVRAGLNIAALRFCSTGLTLAVSILLARLIGPEGMGYYAFAMSVVALAGLPMQMGMPILVLRETAMSERQRDWSRMYGNWSWSARRILKVAILLLPLIAVAGWFLEGLVVPKGGLLTLWAALPMIAFFAAASLRGSALQGLQMPILGLLPDGIVRPAAQLLGLIVFTFALSNELEPHIAVLVNVAASALAFIMGSLFLYCSAPSEVWRAAPDLSRVDEWRRALLPLSLVSGMLIVMQNISVVLLGVFQPVEEVGLYRVALSAATVVTFGMTVVNFVVAPGMAKLHVDMDKREMARTAQIASTVSLAAGTPISLVILLFSSGILAVLYGDDYRDAALPFVILASSKLLQTSFGSCGQLLNMTGNEKAVARALVVGVLVNTMLNLVLCPIFGGTGSALATLGGTFVWNALLDHTVKKKLGFSGSAFQIILRGFHKE